MTEITRGLLRELMRAQDTDKAPPGAGYWVMSRHDYRRVAKLREPFGGYMLPLSLDGRDPVLFGRPIVKTNEQYPIRFILWCERCGHWLRWDGTGQCQHCHRFIPGTAEIQHQAMMAVARERWPEMVEEPQIVAAHARSLSVEMAILDAGGSLWQGKDPDLLADRPPPYRRERITPEPVGGHRLGYGPISQTLVIWQEAQPC